MEVVGLGTPIGLTYDRERNPQTVRPSVRLPASDDVLSGVRLRHHALALGVIALATTLVFANALDNGFHMDDAVRIEGNAEIRRVLPLGRHFRDPATLTSFAQLTAFRPLMPLTLSVDVALGGDRPASFRRTNLLIHVASAGLAYGLVLELMAASGAAFAGPAPAALVALAYAVHPVAGVTINYLSARDLVLMQAFMLASLFLYVRMRRRGGPAWLWAPILASALLSLLGKMNVALPAVVWALEYGLLDRRRGLWRAGVRALPFAGVVLAVFAYTRVGLGFSELANVADAAGSPLAYGVDQLRLHGAHYLWHFVWPWSMGLFPDLSGAPWRDLRLVLGVVALAGLVSVAVLCRRAQPLVATGVLAYLVLMLPESSLLPLSHAHMPYRPYPGMLFLFVAAASALYTWSSPTVASGVLALFVLWSGLASVRLNPVWRTSETLFSHAVAHGGGHQAHLNLAAAYPNRMDPRILASLEQAMRLAPPSDTQTRFKLGIQLVQTQSDVERGLALVRAVAAERPDYSLYPFGLGEALAYVGRPEEGLPYIERAVGQAPTFLEYRLRAALVRLQVGDLEGARAHLEVIARTNPAFPGLAEARARLAQR